MKSNLFNRSKLNIKPLSERISNLGISVVKEINPETKVANTNMFSIASDIVHAKKSGRSIVCMYGAHVLRSGVQKYIIDLMERGYITCIAMNGAGIIHDFEFALYGKTTESVAKYIQSGEFGLWQETGQLNDIINCAYKLDNGAGMGYSVGKHIEENNLKHSSTSLLAAAYRMNIPATVHVGIGYDIIHEHPNCDGAATGALSYNDFLRFASVVQNLENGVVMNFGSAVMAPEIFLKALSMARNVAVQKNKQIRHFSTLVCDLHELPEEIEKEPCKGNPNYYFRPWKTMLVRTVADGGKSFYVKGRHENTVPELWAAIKLTEDKYGKSS